MGGHCTLCVAENSTHRVTHILSPSPPSPQLKDHPLEAISCTGEAEEDWSWTLAPFTLFPNAHSSLERELAALLFRSPIITLQTRWPALARRDACLHTSLTTQHPSDSFRYILLPGYPGVWK